MRGSFPQNQKRPGRDGRAPLFLVHQTETSAAKRWASKRDAFLTSKI